MEENGGTVHSTDNDSLQIRRDRAVAARPCSGHRVLVVAAQLEHLEDVTPETPAWWTRSALPGMALDDAGNDIARA